MAFYCHNDNENFTSEKKKSVFSVWWDFAAVEHNSSLLKDLIGKACLIGVQWIEWNQMSGELFSEGQCRWERVFDCFYSVGRDFVGIMKLQDKLTQ